jgi:hypothetical protein
MRAAANAAKGSGQLPPQLWRWQICGQPTWSEFDDTSYTQLVQSLILKRVYDTVQGFRSGNMSDDMKKHYAELVKDGIVGRGVK